MDYFTVKPAGLFFYFSHCHWLFFFFLVPFWKQFHWSLFQREEKKTHQWGQRAEQHLGTEPSHTKRPQKDAAEDWESHKVPDHSVFQYLLPQADLLIIKFTLNLWKLQKQEKKSVWWLGHRSQDVWFPFLVFLQVCENAYCLQSVSNSSHCIKRTEQCS